MTAHTPGPWYVTLRPNRVAHRGALGVMRAVATAHAGRFFTDDGAEHMGGRDSDAIPSYEAIANARLIAAAPDLLAALRGMVSAAAPHFNADDYDRDPTVIAARAAIARATGETP